MKPLCRIFGHKLPEAGWWGDGLYGAVHGGKRDGLDRAHYEVWFICSRCGAGYIGARFHGSAVKER